MFPFEQTKDGKWIVHLDQSTVTVHAREDAELIASLRVELHKFRSDTRQEPDIARARQVVEACKRYHLYGQVYAVRELDSRVNKHPDPAK